jgi:hypothetical protein
MKMIRLLPALLAIVLCSSCVPLSSIYSLWDEHHTAELPGLEGTWTDMDGSTLVFVKSEAAKYKLTYSGKDGVSRYEVRAVDINGRFFLDFYPDQKVLEKRLEGEAYLPLISAHFFGRIVLSGNSLQLGLLDDEAVEKKVKEGGPAVPLLKWEDGIVLTADTKSLQTLLDRFADDPALWGETGNFTRKLF